MKEIIVTKVALTEPIQYIFIYKGDSVETIETDMLNLVSNIVASAEKYGIKNIKIAGVREFALKVKERLTEKINIRFDKVEDFNIELI